MPKIIDWTEQKFFNITLIKKLPIKNRAGRWLWLGVCECGTQLQLDPCQVKRGSIKHCGCQRKTKAKDWTGKTFNNLTFIKRCDRTLGSKIRWEVLCKCGLTSIVVPYEVVKGKTKTCGRCPKPSKSKNWTNIKQGKLTFLERYRTYSSGQMVWKAQCDCKNIIYTVPSNNAQSCGCLGKEKNKKWCSLLGKSGRKYHPNESAARQVWYRYQDGDIDFDTFYKLSQLKCKYCGIDPNTRYEARGGLFIYNGLDRIDSSKGHYIANVVPCCWECNESKKNKSPEAFISHAKRIIDYQSTL